MNELVQPQSKGYNASINKKRRLFLDLGWPEAWDGGIMMRPQVGSQEAKSVVDILELDVGTFLACRFQSYDLPWGKGLGNATTSCSGQEVMVYDHIASRCNHPLKERACNCFAPS